MGYALKQGDFLIIAADIVAHTVIIEGLCTLTPDIQALSEEDPPVWEARQHWQHHWLVDPLDGPKNSLSAMENLRSILR